MIKLTRPSKPQELIKNEETLRARYNKNKKSCVWKEKYIKEALLKMSHGKCVYCETKLNECDSYMEVDHFHCKSLYPKLVVDWDNLLPACRRCNLAKSDHNVQEEPIINPVDVDPKEYLVFSWYQYYPRNRDVLGENTIDVLDLNDTDKLGVPRLRIGSEICKNLEDCREQMEKLISAGYSSTKDERNIKRKFEAILKEAIPEKEFSALVATVIFDCPDYAPLKSLLKEAGMWTTEMTELEQGAYEIALCRNEVKL